MSALAAVVVGVGGWAAVGGAEAAGAATLPGGTWGLNQTLPGQVINALSCTAPGDCVAVGYSATDMPIAVTETAGTWGSAHPISGAASLGTGKAAELTSVSCGATGYCTAAGTYTGTGSTSHAWYVTETDGAWGTATALSEAGQPAGTTSTITGVSCPAAGYCAVVGNYATTTTTVPFLVDQADGTWNAPQSVPGLSALPSGGSSGAIIPTLWSVSCAAPGACTAAGGYIVPGTTSHFQVGVPFEVNETNGTWGTATALSDASQGPAVSDITSLSCPDATDCTALDVTGAPLAPGGQVFTVAEQHGTWGTPSELATAPSIDNVAEISVTLACASAGDCVLAGTYGGPNDPVADTETSGQWGTVTPIALPSSTGTGTGSAGAIASCAHGGDCTIVANYDSARMFAVTSTGGVLGKAKPVAQATGSNQNIAALACPQSGYCTLVYNLSNKSGSTSVPKAVTEATASTVTVKASAPAVKAFSGKNLTVSFTVTVTSPEGTPGGRVWVRKNGTILAGCSAKALSGGKAACTAKTGILAPARYALTAVYSGNADFASAVSAARYLTVTKAKTATTLTLSKSAVRYGHESAAKLTVKVSHVGGVYPTGKVAVRSGKTTLCTIKLDKGTGSCHLTGKRLKKGSYKIVAVYAGNTDYKTSTSPGKTLKVAA